MSHLTTSEDLPSATFSPGSASGLIPSASPDGQMIARSGLAPARASLSARQAKEMGLLTSGTFGPTSSISSASADLSMSLANRLQAVTQTYGSTLYKLTWKEWDTPSGLCRLRQRASVLRTSESELTGWPTPTASSVTGAGTSGRQGGMNIQTAAMMSGWPTPTTIDNNQVAGQAAAANAPNRGTTLGGAARMAGWVTPTSRDWKHFWNDGAAGREGTTGPAASPGVHLRALEVNGFWRDADWLLCRDGKWRPVEPGTFPLVDGAAARMGRVEPGVARVASSNRVGRLKGYGNAINAQAAAAFIRAYMGVA